MKTGRLRIEAAIILSENGWPCGANEIIVTHGPLRKMDICNWSARGKLCWQTLAEFVKYARAGHKVVVDGTHEFNISCYP